jgi:hypothetical protein
MYVLRFPLHLWPKIRPVFEQQGLTEQLDFADGRIVARLDDEQATMLKLDPTFRRIGPIGGWRQSRDRDRPITPPPNGLDFS